MKPIDTTYGILSTLYALQGIVTPNLRAVTIKVDKEHLLVKICFFYHGEISEEDFEDASCAITEIISDFPPDYQLDDHIERLDMPKKIPVDDRLVYLRKELQR